ncbi:hypothetical protein [Persephonella hydrogeniphila]|uniref:hypothetical protein n=1 Tax=Persephonella hydrogeniphila TaxID=198703 RepID=UPI0011813C57|nr:hypothetical protein [Persephonella hydrogeniphila]
MNTEVENCFLIRSYTINDLNNDELFTFQFIFVFGNTPAPAEIQNIQHQIKTYLDDDIKEKLSCLPYMKIKQKIKDTKILRNVPIFIIDLKRSGDRSYAINTDAVLTKKLIFDILKIAENHNFKSINHTGDGFIFMYTASFKNLSIDMNNFLDEIKIWFKSFKDYMQTLSKGVNNYKIRGDSQFNET